MTTAVTRAYRAGEVVARDFPVSEVATRLAEPETIVWVDVVDPQSDELRALADALDFHDLALEDTRDDRQRPKLDHYDTHVFLTLRALRLDDNATLRSSAVSAFVSTQWIVTVREDDALDMNEVCDRADGNTELAHSGVAQIVHAVLDVIVDAYFDVVDRFDDYYDAVSEQLFLDHPIDTAKQRHWFEMGRALGRFHRLVSPTTSLITRLMNRERQIVDDTARPYFQDVYDHMLRVGESVDGLREVVAALIEANLGLRADRQSRIAKHVSGWAGVLAVPTLVTGFYGMNVPYPGSGETWGWWMSLLVMLGLSGTLYTVFKRRDWL